MNRQTDQQIIYGLIRRWPGLPVAWYGWLRGGGKVTDGAPCGDMVINFRTYQKVIKVQQRIHELAKSGKVHMKHPAVQTMTSGLGVYPGYGPDSLCDSEGVSEPLEKIADKKDWFPGLRDALGVRK